MHNSHNIHQSLARPGINVGIVPLVFAVASILIMVWVIVYLGSNTLSAVQLPEDVRLTNFVIVQKPDMGWLGIQLLDQQSKVAISGKHPQGVMISKVLINSPADKAGLLPGDIISRLNKTKTDNPMAFNQALVGNNAGDTLRMTVFRDGVDRKVHIRVGANPYASFVAARTQIKGSPAWFGIDVQPIDNMMLEQFGLPDNHGVVVSWVYPNSPAQSAGIQQGDVLRRIDNVRIRDAKQLSGLLSNKQPGDNLRITIFQQGTLKDINVALSSPPPPGTQVPPPLAEAEVEVEAAWLGLDILPLTKAEAEELGLSSNIRGVVVDGVAAGPGTDAGFQVGDVIIAVNGEATPTINQFADATEGAVGAVVDVIRYGRHIYISIPPPGQDPANQNNTQNLQQIVYNPLP